MLLAKGAVARRVFQQPQECLCYVWHRHSCLCGFEIDNLTASLADGIIFGMAGSGTLRGSRARRIRL